MHGMIIKTLPNPEETDRIIRSAVESGADESKLRTLASKGMLALFTAPEIKFAWQRTWPECSHAPELVLASRVGYRDKVLQLLSLGNDPNAAQDDGTTALIAASEVTDEVIVGELIAAGARPDTQASDGRTALAAAAYSGSTTIAKLLLDAPELVLASRVGYRDKVLQLLSL